MTDKTLFPKELIVPTLRLALTDILSVTITPAAIRTAFDDVLQKMVAAASMDAVAALQRPCPAYLDTEDAAVYTGISTYQLEQWRSHGGGPKYVKLPRLVKYPRSCLDEFMMSRLRDNVA